MGSRSAPADVCQPADPFRALSCADWLPVVAPHLSTSLVSQKALRRLHAVARLLPGDAMVALEVRLGVCADRVDLSLRLTEPGRSHPWVDRLASGRLARFLACWSEPGFAPVRFVWLEFDLDREPHGLPEPVLCAGLQAGVDHEWLLETLLPALDGDPRDAGRRRLFGRCLEAIPAPARLIYLFDLRARGTDAVRFEIRRIAPPAMIAYLERVGAGDGARRVTELAPLVAGCDRYHLSFDVSDEIGPRVGVEASFRRLPHREPGWQRLVDRLVERGLCTREKRDTLFDWPGWDSARTAPERWPAALRRPGLFCARALSHVKLVLRPDREPEAKAYLIFQPIDKLGGAPPDRLTPTSPR